MMATWKDVKHLLCVRADNMGDLLMSGPAIKALKETFHCSITVLTSSAATPIAAYMPGVDRVLTWDMPWVKTDVPANHSVLDLVTTLQSMNIDGAVIFTVFSQNPLATALILTMAGIPRRAAYCRENPYELLSHWVPDQEPYSFIRHQVRRDLDLVATIGARTRDERIRLQVPEKYSESAKQKMANAGVDLTAPWLIIHPGVSEKKREYPTERWIDCGRKIVEKLNYQLVVTGIDRERSLADALVKGIAGGAFSVVGKLFLEELIALIKLSPLLVSVNTATIHIAAAVETTTVVLYALTNPQHAPWKNRGRVLPFSVPEPLQSRNEILRYVRQCYFGTIPVSANPEDIFNAVYHILIEKQQPAMPELVSVPGVSANEQHLVFPRTVELPEK